MGVLVNGAWIADESTLNTSDPDGEFKRAQSSVRNWITADGSPGPSGEGGFKAEPGRYHLYWALNCPWAHRAILTRKFKGLEDLISVSATTPVRDVEGWVFDDGSETYRDHLFGSHHMHEVYTRSHPDYTGRVTVPVLWDKERDVMVSNESSEIIRMLNSAFDDIGANDLNLYPENLRAEIDQMNDFIYHNVNNGVYRCGFATSQAAYDQAIMDLFGALDSLDQRFGSQRYLMGDTFTEADVRLFPSLVRFDTGYHSGFRCNKKYVAEYPNLWAYARECYQMPGVAETVDLDIYRRGYNSMSPERNPLGIIPVGPDVDFDEPVGQRPGQPARSVA
ncbi:MAG: glutathione S-transferase family protein [Rhodospirillales bacterium]|nr:glutathione S-transferase family protein [Rhodospirillales bacterium]